MNCLKLIGLFVETTICWSRMRSNKACALIHLGEYNRILLYVHEVRWSMGHIIYVIGKTFTKVWKLECQKEGINRKDTKEKKEKMDASMRHVPYGYSIYLSG
jgi:hypothetical protein